MSDIELIVKKNTIECKNSIKDTIPYFYDSSFMSDSGKWKWKVYSYKEKNDDFMIIGRGFAYIPVSLKLSFLFCNENETKLIGVFNSNIVSRLIIWIGTLLIFIFSLFYLICILIGEVSIKDSPVSNILLPLVNVILSMTYLVYSERTRKNEKKSIIKLIADIVQQ